MKEKTFSKDIANIVNVYLKEDGWDFSFNEQHGMFRFGLRLGSVIKTINYCIDIKEDSYIVYAVSPIGLDCKDEKLMSSMAEFICRANYGLKNGNFELDMSDGEIRYKSYVDCAGIMPTSEIVKDSIICPASMFECYGTGIVDVMLRKLTPTEAIVKCEKSSIEKGLRAFLGEDPDGDEDLETMLGWLSTYLDAASSTDSDYDFDKDELEEALANLESGQE